jgi:nitroreductase
MDLLTALRSRRTIKAFTGQAVSRETVSGLVEAACWTPNHRLTQPWRFAAVDREGVARLVAFVQQPPVCDAVFARKLPAICERLAACGALVQVTCLLAGDDEHRREDRDATAAAVQSLLLAAQAAGLGSFWSTSPLLSHPEVLRWFGADPMNEAHVATVWLGTAAEQPVPPRRRALAEVLRWA